MTKAELERKVIELEAQVEVLLKCIHEGQNRTITVYPTPNLPHVYYKNPNIPYPAWVGSGTAVDNVPGSATTCSVPMESRSVLDQLIN